jgi:glycosyltransferase involved in cell wall biosynthesis
MKYCDKITFVIFTFNETARVERSVRNFVKYGKVLVVDNYSVDNTAELAVAAGAQVLLHKNPGWGEDENTVSIVKAAITTPWIYWGYSDEIVDRQTMATMLDVIEAGQHAIVNIARKNYYYGNFTHDAYRNRMNRAFQRDAIDFTGNTIHNFGKVTVTEQAIKMLDADRYFVHHFISNTAKAYVYTLDVYTDIEAAHAPLTPPFKMLLAMGKDFFLNFVVRGARHAGRAGFYLAMAMLYYRLLLAMKAYERQHGLTKLTIEERNNKVRDLLLVDLERGPGAP